MIYEIPEGLRKVCRFATSKDAYLIGTNMREDDANDIISLAYYNWLTPEVATMCSWQASLISVAWHRIGEAKNPVGIGGLLRNGVIWSLFRKGFPRDLKDRKDFLKTSYMSIAWFRTVLPDKKLFNVTCSFNKHIIHWMKACGAKITTLDDNGKKLIINGQPVTMFWFDPIEGELKE